MALLRIDHVSESTKVCLPLYMILPDPVRINGVPVRDRKVLYLLHGLSDDGSAWQRFTSIETLASDYGLVVVMPSVGRSFYTDMPNGQNYFTYISAEIPQYLKDVFALDPKREDTYLAGLSMGGYGAMKSAFQHPEKFAAVASFSGVLSMEGMRNHKDTDPRAAEFSLLFGDLEKVPGSQFDPITWVNEAAAHKEGLPKLYAACGKQDDLYPLNKYFEATCKTVGIPLDFHEEDGKHDWYFWDRQICRFLDLVLGARP
jgi:putative tributyrin esterase